VLCGGVSEGISVAAHCRGRATSFVLKQKKQKFKLVRRLLCRKALPCKTGRTWAGNIYSLLRRSYLRFSKNFQCPAAAWAIFVLPAFG